MKHFNKLQIILTLLLTPGFLRAQTNPDIQIIEKNPTIIVRKNQDQTINLTVKYTKKSDETGSFEIKIDVKQDDSKSRMYKIDFDSVSSDSTRSDSISLIFGRNFPDSYPLKIKLLADTSRDIVNVINVKISLINGTKAQG